MKDRHHIESATTASDLRSESATSVGDRLRMARIALGMTQKQCADASGVPMPSHKKYEGSHSIPGGEALEGYVRAGISANWLVAGEGPMLRDNLIAEQRAAYAATAAEALDADHLLAVIEGVELALQELRLTLPIAKKAQLFTAIYELTQESGRKPQRETVLRLVRSAA